MLRTAKILILQVIAFFLIGEIVARFDNATHFFADKRSKRIDNVMKETDELHQVNENSFIFKPTDLRVLIIGDSKLYGVGIKTDSIFSRHLKNRLNEKNLPGFESVSILDVTIPGVNTFGNRIIFEKFLPLFKPHVVILCYSYNDVYGKMEKEIPTESNQNITSIEDTEQRDAIPKFQSGTKTGDPFVEYFIAVRKMLFHSTLLTYILPTINLELKLAGIVVPNTVFDNMVNRAYLPDNEGWIKAQKHLESMTQMCEEKNINFLLLVTPHLNMLSNYDKFDKLYETVSDYCRNNNIDIMRGIDCFLTRKGGNYALSRYDGHPNNEAHAILAAYVFDFMNRNYSR